MEQFKVGVTTGLHAIAAAPELANAVRKLGYALTRGANVIEIAGDVPHEIDYSMGKELRYIAEKQNIELTFHGSLTVPMEIGDAEHWREADDHLRKSTISAIFGGCKYIDFHSCLYPWVELLTYAEVKTIVIMVDEIGRHILQKLKECELLRKWFCRVSRFPLQYDTEILGPQKVSQIRSFVDEEWRQGKIKLEETSQVLEKRIREAMEEHLAKGEKWFIEEVGNLNVIYKIMAHFLYYTQDPIWKEMGKLYEDVLKRLEEKLPSEIKSRAFSPVSEDIEKTKDYLDEMFEIAKRASGPDERKFKEFYYACVGAKYLCGHLKKLIEFIIDELPKQIEEKIKALSPEKIKEEEKNFERIIKEFKIAIENPDARAPSYAGLYPLWHPKQIYVAIKILREELEKDTKTKEWANKVFILIDSEHLSTQGADPLFEYSELVKLIPDIGKYILTLHVTKPSPLHHHIEVELGDIEVYKLLWTLRKAGLGKYHTVYLIYERGGGEDPFKRSVTAIRIMAEFLQKDVPPEQLINNPEFFGVATQEIASPERQRVIIMEHAFDPLKGLIVAPEEEYTFLGGAAIQKPGIGPEKWKKEELK
ncbi:MAG: hypothetical protein QW412_02000 [Candidatus Aenigmatarchaeota archaeon]